MGRNEIITTSKRGLREDSFPYRLYQKAKKFGTWNPSDIDFSKDKEDWKTLLPEQQEQILKLISQFQAGEEAVTLDLLPLIMVIAKEGRIEEEIFLTTFLYEEAKHTEFFRIVLNTLGAKDDLSHYHTPTYRKIFYEILPEAMEKLVHDHSPEAMAEASTVYNMFVEGVLAETGYFSFYNSLDALGKMPGLMKGIGYLKKDESRHIGYGTYLLQRLICEKPSIYELVVKKMQELAPLSVKLNEEGMNGQEVTSFGGTLEDTVAFSQKQINARMEVIGRARYKSLDEIYKTTDAEVGVTS
ncbi:R2-like ligand-binding oxidase [Pseudalkalibacillus caeni]|uniref:R2-like ligand binding oxidase n=1 Tax=Exobacillus caeni TaxID=2574798 RepID=A0A5R9F1B6_9BACL|nr:R2-like ligand-binding oxidase [Pseudalkalibacillus caeni]TLS36220.1 R2-like ligand-binding oxidase [Pseudalkalibacillus caeni]